MSPAFIKGIKEQFPLDSIIFDRFHIMKLFNEAVLNIEKQQWLILKNGITGQLTVNSQL